MIDIVSHSNELTAVSFEDYELGNTSMILLIWLHYLFFILYSKFLFYFHGLFIIIYKLGPNSEFLWNQFSIVAPTIVKLGLKVNTRPVLSFVMC